MILSIKTLKYAKVIKKIVNRCDEINIFYAMLKNNHSEYITTSV